MSLKKPRVFRSPAIVPANRSGEHRLQALAACVAALLACGPVTSTALEIGEAAMRSGIGQPLAVQIPYRLAAGEQLTPSCIGLAPASGPQSGLPIYAPASRVAITPTHIEIFGDARVREPLIGLTVDVHCSTAPRFARSYQLFVDPPGQMPAAVDNAARVAEAERAPVVEAIAPSSLSLPRASAAPQRTVVPQADSPQRSTDAPRASASPRARGQAGGPVTQGQTYVVVPGDTLSGIAARVSDRSMTIRETADAIFAANPGAFRRGNRDLLEAGRSIAIPFLAAAVEPPAESAAAPRMEAVAASAATLVPALAPAATLPSTATPAPAETLAAPVTTAPAPTTAPASTLAPALTAAPAVSVPAEIPSDEQRLPIEPAPVATAAEPIAVAPSPIALSSNAAPAPAPSDTVAEAAPPASGRASMWLSMLVAFGAGALLSASVLLRRRTKEARPEAKPAEPRRPQARTGASPTAGFEVSEGRMPRTPSAQPPTRAPAPTPIDSEATARLPQPARSAAPVRRSREPLASSPKDEIGDAQHTVTVVELDLLRQDYEIEHTLTQGSIQPLRDTLADLKATKAARAAADTAEVQTLKTDAVRNRA